MEVVRGFLRIGEQGAEVRQFGVCGLRVVERQCLRGVAPGFVWLVERHPVLAVPAEIIVILYGGT